MWENRLWFLWGFFCGLFCPVLGRNSYPFPRVLMNLPKQCTAQWVHHLCGMRASRLRFSFDWKVALIERFCTSETFLRKAFQCWTAFLTVNKQTKKKHQLYTWPAGVQGKQKIQYQSNLNIQSLVFIFISKMCLSKCKFSHAVHLLFVLCVYYENVCFNSCICWGVFL